MKEEIRKIDDKIRKLKDKIWDLQLQKRELSNRVTIKGCTNTKA